MHLSRRHFLGLTATAPVFAALGQQAVAASPMIYAEDGIAVDGSDVVGYFTESRPVAGDPAITLDYMGATWRFASVENRSMFEADPKAYTPQYGGYCAFAMSKGYIAPTIPEAWTIHNGKLYLNFSLRARTLWLQDVEGNIAAGDANWPSALG